MRSCRPEQTVPFSLRMFITVSLIVMAALPVVAREEPFALQGGERVLFFGDSITQAGLYVTYVEAYLLTRFPDRQFTVINHGISSETVSGTSEPDHSPRRPNALDRFARDVAAWKPDVVVACFGMNDGNYHPFDQERFAAYQKGVQTLIERVHNEAHARVVLLTPPPFDPYRRQVGDPNATHYGYKFPAVDYDQTLAHYSDWLGTLAGEKLVVADVHSATNEHLMRRRRERVSFFLAGDAVHPNATGHWLMAQTLLFAWHAPATCAEAAVDVALKRAEKGDVSEVDMREGALEATWRTPIPMPLDPSCDGRSLALERVAERLNRYRLTVTGLHAGRYRLLAKAADGTTLVPVAELAADNLAAGVDLTAHAAFPTVRQAQHALDLLQARNRARYDAWRKQVASTGAQADAASEPEVEPPLAQIRRLCQPQVVRLRIEPVNEK